MIHCSAAQICGLISNYIFRSTILAANFHESKQYNVSPMKWEVHNIKSQFTLTPY